MAVTFCGLEGPPPALSEKLDPEDLQKLNRSNQEFQPRGTTGGPRIVRILGHFIANLYDAWLSAGMGTFRTQRNRGYSADGSSAQRPQYDRLGNPAGPDFVRNCRRRVPSRDRTLGRWQIVTIAGPRRFGPKYRPSGAGWPAPRSHSRPGMAQACDLCCHRTRLVGEPGLAAFRRLGHRHTTCSAPGAGGRVRRLADFPSVHRRAPAIGPGSGAGAQAPGFAAGRGHLGP
jgi:hypothetical protein